MQSQLGERTGSLLGIISLSIYILLFSHPFIFVISMFDILAHRLFIGSVQCLCASCLCIHACTPMCYIIPHHPFDGLHIRRVLYIWRNLFCLEGYLLGGLCAWRAVSLFFCVSLSFLSPGLDQLSFHQEKVLDVDMGFLKSHVDMRDSCPHTKNPI